MSSPNGAEIFVRSSGSGPVVVLLHGYAETSDSWAPLATELVKSYTVVVPDLRGIGELIRTPMIRRFTCSTVSLAVASRFGSRPLRTTFDCP
jgi:pimeloyl-ACP methyl ester carboxylesterase